MKEALLLSLRAVLLSVKEPALVKEFYLVAVFFEKGSLHLVLKPGWHAKTSNSF